MIYGFNFNGQHSSNFGLISRPKRRQLLPDNNDAYVQIPGRHGSYLFPGSLSDRIFVLGCAVVEKSIEDLSQKASDIAAWLYTTDREILSFDDEPGKYYRAKLDRPVDVEQVATLGRFEVTFRCEPFAHGGDQNANFVADAVVVDNQGTFEALPMFSATLTAAATEWKVTLGSKFVRVVHDFQIDDTLEVNTATGAILINGNRAMDKLDWQNSRFFNLRVGENTLTITPAGVCTARVSWVPRYL